MDYTYIFTSQQELYAWESHYKYNAHCKKHSSGKSLCLLKIVDEDVMTVGTHKRPFTIRRQECPASIFVIHGEGTVDSETYKVPETEVNCTHMHRSAMEMLSSHRPPPAANVGTKYERTHGDMFGVGSAIYYVQNKTNETIQVERKVMEYGEMQEGCNTPAALEGNSWCRGFSTSVIKWKRGEEEEHSPPISAMRKLTVKIIPLGLAENTKEFNLTTKIRLVNKTSTKCLHDKNILHRFHKLTSGQGKSLHLSRYEKQANLKQAREMPLDQLLAFFACNETTCFGAMHNLSDYLRLDINAKKILGWVIRQERKGLQKIESLLSLAAALCESALCQKVVVELQRSTVSENVINQARQMPGATSRELVQLYFSQIQSNLKCPDDHLNFTAKDKKVCENALGGTFLAMILRCEREKSVPGNKTNLNHWPAFVGLTASTLENSNNGYKNALGNCISMLMKIYLRGVQSKLRKDHEVQKTRHEKEANSLAKLPSTIKRKLFDEYFEEEESKETNLGRVRRMKKKIARIVESKVPNTMKQSHEDASKIRDAVYNMQDPFSVSTAGSFLSFIAETTGPHHPVNFRKEGLQLLLKILEEAKDSRYARTKDIVYSVDEKVTHLILKIMLDHMKRHNDHTYIRYEAAKVIEAFKERLGPKQLSEIEDASALEMDILIGEQQLSGKGSCNDACEYECALMNGTACLDTCRHGCRIYNQYSKQLVSLAPGHGRKLKDFLKSWTFNVGEPENERTKTLGIPTYLSITAFMKTSNFARIGLAVLEGEAVFEICDTASATLEVGDFAKFDFVDAQICIGARYNYDIKGFMDPFVADVIQKAHSEIETLKKKYMPIIKDTVIPTTNALLDNIETLDKYLHDLHEHLINFENFAKKMVKNSGFKNAQKLWEPISKLRELSNAHQSDNIGVRSPSMHMVQNKKESCKVEINVPSNLPFAQFIPSLLSANIRIYCSNNMTTFQITIQHFSGEVVGFEESLHYAKIPEKVGLMFSRALAHGKVRPRSILQARVQNLINREQEAIFMTKFEQHLDVEITMLSIIYNGSPLRYLGKNLFNGTRVVWRINSTSCGISRAARSKVCIGRKCWETKSPCSIQFSPTKRWDDIIETKVTSVDVTVTLYDAMGSAITSLKKMYPVDSDTPVTAKAWVSIESNRNLLAKDSVTKVPCSIGTSCDNYISYFPNIGLMAHLHGAFDALSGISYVMCQIFDENKNALTAYKTAFKENSAYLCQLQPRAIAGSKSFVVFTIFDMVNNKEKVYSKSLFLGGACTSENDIVEVPKMFSGPNLTIVLRPNSQMNTETNYLLLLGAQPETDSIAHFSVNNVTENQTISLPITLSYMTKPRPVFVTLEWCSCGQMKSIVRRALFKPSVLMKKTKAIVSQESRKVGTRARLASDIGFKIFFGVARQERNWMRQNERIFCLFSHLNTNASFVNFKYRASEVKDEPLDVHFSIDSWQTVSVSKMNPWHEIALEKSLRVAGKKIEVKFCMMAGDGKGSSLCNQTFVQIIDETAAPVSLIIPATLYAYPKDTIINISTEWNVRMSYFPLEGSCVLFAGYQPGSANYGIRTDMRLNGKIQWTIAYDRHREEEEETYIYFTMCCETQLGESCSAVSSIIRKAPDLKALADSVGIYLASTGNNNEKPLSFLSTNLLYDIRRSKGPPGLKTTITIAWQSCQESKSWDEAEIEGNKTSVFHEVIKSMDEGEILQLIVEMKWQYLSIRQVYNYTIDSTFHLDHATVISVQTNSLIYVMQNVYDQESSIRWDMSRYRAISLYSRTALLPYQKIGSKLVQIFKDPNLSFAFRGLTSLPVGKWMQVEVRVVNGAGQSHTIISKPFLLK
eukprot:g4169.t1